jgi:hypothetical protein
VSHALTKRVHEFLPVRKYFFNDVGDIWYVGSQHNASEWDSWKSVQWESHVTYVCVVNEILPYLPHISHYWDKKWYACNLHNYSFFFANRHYIRGGGKIISISTFHVYNQNCRETRYTCSAHNVILHVLVSWKSAQETLHFPYGPKLNHICACP